MRTLIAKIPFAGKFFLISQWKVFPPSMETHPASCALPFGRNVLAPGFPLLYLSHVELGSSFPFFLVSQVNYQHTSLQASLLGWAWERGRAVSTVSNSKYVVSFSLNVLMLIKIDLKASGRVIHTLYKAFLKQKNETAGISHVLKNCVSLGVKVIVSNFKNK